MTDTRTRDGHEGHRRFQQFRADAGERVFEWPTCHPAGDTGFCPCHGSIIANLGFLLKGTAIEIAMRLPFSGLKLRVLRAAGARIAGSVYISTDVWIDPLFPDLLTIEDNVIIGSGAKILMHTFDRDRFRAGRVVIRSGAVVGGFAVVAPGVEIGTEATVAVAAVVGRDVPPGFTAIGNPARLIPMPRLDKEERQCPNSD